MLKPYGQLLAFGVHYSIDIEALRAKIRFKVNLEFKRLEKQILISLNNKCS